MNHVTNSKPHITQVTLNTMTFVIKYRHTKTITMENVKDSRRDWDETKRKLKQKYVLLTERDVAFSEDKLDQMLSQIQRKLGKTKEELQRIIAGL